MRQVDPHEGAKAASAARAVILACGYPRARRRHVQAVAAFLLGITLAGCQTTTAFKATCIPPREIPKDEQAKISAAIHALPQDSALRPVVVEWERTRQASRAACPH